MSVEELLIKIKHLEEKNAVLEKELNETKEPTGIMNKDITSYIKVYKNFLDKEVCENAIKELEMVEWQMHQFYDSKNKIYSSTEKELSVYFNSINLKPYFMQKTWCAIEKYILKDLNFSWYDRWAGFTNIRFNRYSEQTNMKLHCDHIHTMFDGTIKGVPILSIVGLLNDDFEGGDFIMWEDTKIELEAGDILLFPSNFLYPHKVLDVIKGKRYSFVSWVY